MDEGRWTTAEVARSSGVTARTLRHYDALGLLVPAGTGAGGVRLYGAAELLRLQQLLLLRELGLPLAEVARVLDAGTDPAAALRAHLRHLEAEGERLARLTRTVRTTLDRLDAGGPMDPGTLYDGFDPVRQARYEAEMSDRYGEDAVAAAVRPDRGEAARLDADFGAAEEQVAVLLRAGRPPDDPAVLDALDAHHAVLCRSWTPDATAYAGLGDLYAEHPDFRARYERRQAGLADYLRTAMAAYAEQRLAG